MSGIPNNKKPGLLVSILKNKCSRCRRGNLFIYNNAYNFRNTMKMHTNCQVCNQALEPEVGFYYGTGFVSYALSIMICVASFILWYLTIGLSLNDNRIFWWMTVNAVLLIIVQPLLMRLSRTIWLAIFVHYDPLWREHPPAAPERNNELHQHNW